MELTDEPNTTTLAEGALQPTTVEQDKSRKVVSLLDTLLTAPGTVAPAGTQIQPVIQSVQTGEVMTTPGVTVTVGGVLYPEPALVIVKLAIVVGLSDTLPDDTVATTASL